MRIENIILNIVKNLYNNNKLVINLTKLSNWSTCVYDNKKHLMTKTLQFQTKRSRINNTIIIYLLSKIYKNLMTKNSCTTRELYYGDTILFKHSNTVRKALIDICCLLGTKSWELGITLSSSGLVAGNLMIYMSNGTSLDCSCTTEGLQIPQDILEIDNLESKAKYILIIEKNASFQKIINEGLLNTNKCTFIMITGKGFPDINTRLFVKQLSCKLNLPILALVDANPFGIEIMCVYRFGSNSMVHQNEMLCVPSIKWLGVYPTDIVSLNLPSITLTNLDQERLKSLLKRSYINSNHKLLQQVLMLHNLNRKSEIESLTTFTQTYLTEVYIKKKILTQDFI
ncbi:meiotic recombination protein SPO11 [Rhopalosiphum maidis]|uniref:meiotic recombination protein SPO11 n=1 Tax=Rhopalosiphum maidis TaxID=43146 RepID=UPI000EFED5BA|nr:meiotic recombination protein SPO11 [Rhopalosiphum maidis]